MPAIEQGCDIAPTTSPPLKHRSVVSNFIVRIHNTDRAEVALFTRSQEVRTYQGKLAPISGTIDSKDRGPLNAAVREIEEETGLVASRDLDLYLKGKPFNISDEAIGRQWTVHPFTWFLRDPSREFQIDWEHTGWQWVRPKDILTGAYENQSVPNLEESFRRVWLRDEALFPEDAAHDRSASTVLEESLLTLKNDHDSGARYMATTALQFLHDTISAIAVKDDESTFWFRIRMIAWHLIINGRASMNAAISKALLQCLRRLRSRLRSKQGILDEIQSCIAERKVSSRKIADSFAHYLTRHFRSRFEKSKGPATISVLTLSSSITKSALLAALRTCDVQFDVRILESRPLCEGAQMASKLLEHASFQEKDRLKITIATDASAAILARDVDLVLLGADRISEAGDVSNKTGSLSAILCAKAVGKKTATSPKIVILSGVEKIAKPGAMDEHDEEDNSPLQIWRIWEMAGCKQNLMQHDKRVCFKNVFFEWVPAEYIDTYLMEGGEVGREKIRELSEGVQRLDDEIFEDM